MNKFKMIVSKYPAKNKKAAQDYIAAFKFYKNVEHKKLAFSELLAIAAKGYTFLSAEVKEGASTMGDKDIVSRQVVFVDVDNDNGEILTFDEALLVMKQNGLKPAGAYRTLSSTEEKPKYRVGFELDRALVDLTEYENLHKIMYTFFTKNGADCVDTSCRDISRVYFGGDMILFEDKGTIQSVDAVLAHTDRLEQFNATHKPGAKKAKKAAKKVNKEEVAAPKEKHPIIEMIRKQDFMGLRNLYKDIQVADFNPTNQDIYSWIDALPLDQLLALKDGEMVRCIYSSHNDNGASAFLFKKDNGNFTYFCHGDKGCQCAQAKNFLNIVMDETGFSRARALQFIAAILNKTLETEWQLSMEKEIKFFRTFLMSESFKEKYPLLHFSMTRSGSKMLYFFIQVTRIMQDKLSHNALSKSGEPALIMSEGQLAKELNVNPKTIASHKNHLVKLGLLKKATDKDMKGKIIYDIHADRIEKQRERRVDILLMPVINDDSLLAAEAILLKDKQNGVRKTYASRAQEIAANGVKEADRIYVQDAGKGLSKRHTDFYNKMVTIITSLIEKHGYATEQMTLKEIKGYKANDKATMLGELTPLLLNSTSIKRERLNKVLRESRNVPSAVKSNTMIFV